MNCFYNKGPCHRVLRLGVIASGLALFIVAFLANPSSAFGQAVGATGAINGTVSDSSGAVIPNAKVTLTNASTGTERSAATNATGIYVFPEVPPGTYTIAVSAGGFATAREERFTIEVNQTATHNFTLTVGAAKQEVTVSGTITHIEASTAELGTAVANKEVNDLPLNGRNFTQLLSLTPGVSPISTAQNAGGGSNWGGNTIGTFTFPSVNGQCNRCNFFLMDGFNDGQVFMGMVGTTPIIDGMQEFKVQSHNDSSSYGGALGGIINVATKAGTNEYHGDVWEFLRNNALDANNFFNNAAHEPTVPYKQNQFGGVFGGPLIPGHFRGGSPKTWFYAAYEGYRSVRSQSSFLNVPTPAELGGDLSALTSTQIYNPWSTRPDPAKPGSYLRDPFMCDSSGNPLPVASGVAGYPAGSLVQAPGTPCNKIPTSLINANLVQYIKTGLPAPIVTNVPGTNAVDTTPNRIRQDTASLRFDHQFTENTSLWFRYSGFTQPDSFPIPWPGASSDLYDHGYQTAVQVTHTFGGGTKVLTAGFARNSAQTNAIYSTGTPANLWSQVGFSSAFAAQFNTGPLNPDLVIGGFNTDTGGHVQDTHMSDVWEEKVDFTWVHGRHTLQMGADVASNNSNSPIEYIDVGFDPTQTSNLESPSGTGAGLASFLLGIPSGATGNTVYRNVLENEYGGWVDGFYFQDSWKATDKLTVNIGMRYDLSLKPIYGGGKSPLNGYVGNLDLGTGQYVLARRPPDCNAAAGVGAPCLPGGLAGLPPDVTITPLGNGQIDYDDYDNWGPRLGLAYRIDSKTVIRSAFAKFFDNWGALSCLAQNYEGTWPTVFQQIAPSDMNYPTPTNPLPSTNWANPFNQGTGAVILPGPTPFNQVQWYADPRQQQAYSEQWNLGIQRAFGTATVLEADYVGQHSSRLDLSGRQNVATTPGPGNPGAAVDPRRPYPYITPTFYDTSTGKASYNAFQFKLRRTSTKGLSYIVSYTWSKTINLGCDGYFGAEGCGVQEVYNLRDDRSVAGFDVPHLLSASATYDLPFGAGRQFTSSNKAVNALIGGWGLTGILTARSGEPFLLGVSGDIANIGGNSERPNIVGPPFPSSRTPAEYINTASFQVPAPYTFGDVGRNAYRLGPASNLDMSLLRDFRIPGREGTRVEFRAEFFNALNQAILGGCLDTTVQDPTFGKATCTRNVEREIQFALKLYF